jgi:hypothetical protein
MPLLKKVFSLNSRAWSASILNVFAMASAFWTLWSSHDAKGTSFIMLGLFLYVQITFAQTGYRDKSWALFCGMVFSAFFTVGCIVLAILYKGVHL